jgi:hypothetical protein
VLVNVGAQAVMVRAGGAITAGVSYQQAAGDPITPTRAASQVTMSSGTVGPPINLPAYSITRVAPTGPLPPF